MENGNRMRYLLFDLDGTLTESGPGILNGVKYALAHMGIREEEEQNLMRFIGPPLTDSFMRFYGMNKEDANRALYAYREYYNTTGVYENAPYPGILKMLRDLRQRNLHMAIASSKPENMVRVVLDYFSMSEYFPVCVCGEDEGPLYTKSGVIAETVRRLAVRDGLSEDALRRGAVMIGDRKHDIEGAKNNGLFSIGVRWGYAPEGELEEAGADLIAETPDALCAFVKDRTEAAGA